MIAPSSDILIEFAAGIRGKPGIDTTSPATTTINCAPADSLISLIGKTGPGGALFKFKLKLT